MPSFSLEREIVGIDLSHHYLRVVQLTNHKDDWSITRLASEHFADKQENEDERLERVVDLLSTIKKEQKFDTDNAAISLPINDAIVQIVQIPYLEEELLNNAVENGSLWQNAISLPGDLSEYSIFWQVIKSDPEAGSMSILFVASNLAKVDKLCSVVKAAGFNPVFVDVRCFALRNISKLYDSDSSETSVYLEISGYENYMVFIHKDMPFIYDIFVTDSDINQIITKNGLIEPDGYSRIASQVKDTVDLFLKQSGESGIGEINLVSSLDNISAISEGLSGHINFSSIRVLNPFRELKLSKRISLELESQKNLSSYSVALGLATRRLDILNKTVTKAVANINLLPNRQVLIESETKKSNSQIRAARVAGYLILLMIISLTLYIFMRFGLPTEEETFELESKNQALRIDLDKIKAEFKEYSHWFNDVEMKNRQVVSLDILEEIPLGVYVLEFKQSREGMSEISLQSGSPVLVSAIIDKMTKKYKNVKLISVESDSDNTYQISKVTFEIK